MLHIVHYDGYYVAESVILDDMKVVFDHATQEASNITTFWLKPERQLAYTSGQYVQLTLKHDEVDDRGERRWFTLSSRPEQDLLSITTKYAGDGKSSSFKKALFHLAPGAELAMNGPMGDFVLPKDASIPLVFVAGGIGLTPFHSMFEWLAAHHQHRNIRFIYGVRNESEIVFQDTFERANIHATIVVSEPSDAWGGERGQLSGELILGLAHPTGKTLIYLSGPEPMIEGLADQLKTQGVPATQIVTDFFPGYTTI